MKDGMYRQGEKMKKRFYEALILMLIFLLAGCPIEKILLH